MLKSQGQNESTKDIIIKIVKERKPEDTSQLIRLVQETTSLPEKDILGLLAQLETEDKIHFNMNRELVSVWFGTYLFTFESAWYWIIITAIIATSITVFAVTPDVYPLSYVRNVLGLIFVQFLPGYAFTKVFFPTKVPIKTPSKNLDIIERTLLSIVMSIALTPIVGLVLYYTPIGIGLTPITLSLLALTTVLATAAVFREYNAKSIANQLTY